MNVLDSEDEIDEITREIVEVAKVRCVICVCVIFHYKELIEGMIRFTRI